MHTILFFLLLFQQQPEISLPLAYQAVVFVATVAGAYGASRAGTSAALKEHSRQIRELKEETDKHSDQLIDHHGRISRVEGKVFGNGAALRR